METPNSRSVSGSSLHPALVWLLAASLLATAWALWWPSETDPLLQTNAPASSRAMGQMVPMGQTASRSSEQGRSQLVAGAAGEGHGLAALSPASRDPFNIAVAAPLGAQAKVATEPVRQEPTPAPPPPAAPAMGHVVVGQFLSPEGHRLIFLQDGPQTVVAAPGLALASGYVIEELTDAAIRLRHPLAEQPVSLLLPSDIGP